MSVFVYGTCYVDNNDKFEMFRGWLKCMKQQGIDPVVVDSASPYVFQIRQLMGEQNHVSFPNNIGHLAVHGQDGWGRAFCAGLKMAIIMGQEYAVHIECDLLWKPSILAVIDRMRREKKPVASMHGKPYGWLETGSIFMNTTFMRDIGFIGKYDWPNRVASDYPEQITEQIIGPQNILYMDEFNGCRDDSKQIVDASSLDYVTHCSAEARDSFMGAIRA